MSARSEAERAEYEKTVYEGTQVLVNLLAIRDAATLDAAERAFTDLRISEGLPAACIAPTYEAFKAIHRHLFQDLYAWAGSERTYTTGRGPAPFAVPEHIRPWMEKQFEAFRASNELRGLNPAEFASKAAELICEINAAHPFVEGNGRVQRIWLAGVAERAGYEFSVRPEDREPWYAASRIGFEAADSAPMAALILARIQDLDSETQSLNDKRAAQFLALSREEGLASGDASFRAAWQNLEKIESVARSAMLHDAETCSAIIGKAREQMADHIKAGATIRELTAEQAWRNAPGTSPASTEGGEVAE